jgi:hypothetical protein
MLTSFPAQPQKQQQPAMYAENPAQALSVAALKDWMSVNASESFDAGVEQVCAGLQI